MRIEIFSTKRYDRDSLIEPNMEITATGGSAHDLEFLETHVSPGVLVGYPPAGPERLHVVVVRGVAQCVAVSRDEELVLVELDQDAQVTGRCDRALAAA